MKSLQNRTASLPKDSISMRVNQHIGLYKKWQALVGNLAKTLLMAEGTKLTCVGDYK